MADEIIFFQNGNITVTNARFIAGAQTFAVRGITSVEGVEISPSFAGPVVLALLGLVMATGFLTGAFLLGILGALTLAGSIWLFIRRKPQFVVVLRSASGEVRAYQDTDKSHIAQIIQALNQAIVSNS